jgi:hypothetical protein
MHGDDDFLIGFCEKVAYARRHVKKITESLAGLGEKREAILRQKFYAIRETLEAVRVGALV